MVKRNNFLMGQGQRLTSNVTVQKGSGPKDTPYSFSEARTRVVQKLVAVKADLRALPDVACPNDEAVATITMHPRYLSKSEFPSDLLRAAGLRPIGSRPKKVQPDKWGTKKTPTEEVVTAEIFVAGPRHSFDQLDSKLQRWPETNNAAAQIIRIESMDPYAAADKVRSLPEDREELVLEVVLQDGDQPWILAAFYRYAQMIGVSVAKERVDRVGSLVFVPVRAHRSLALELAKFSFVRVARGMPGIRPFDLVRGCAGFTIQLPQEGPLDPDLRVAVFDGGLQPAYGPLEPWVNYFTPQGLGKLDANSQAHGMGVTSALLFGPLAAGTPLPRPFAKVDHYAVLDENVGQNGDFEVLDVLDRVIGVLDNNPGKYRFINLSLGPDLAVDDGDVTLWTAKMDERLGQHDIFATVAVGNCGHLDPATGANRVQPPSDGVNVLAVGAADSQGVSWGRADYSCVGPGRSPGRIKPDGLGFGGSFKEYFHVLDDCQNLSVRMERGTSFASPAVLRTAVGVRACLGEAMSPLAIRGLLIHRAEKEPHHHQYDVGHGRFESDVSRLITCGDDEVTVVYQGELPTGQHMRAPIPLPDTPLTGMVEIKATLLISPAVDPAHPFTYTRDGIEATFRPHAGKFNFDKEGKQSVHPKSKTFFPGNSPAELEKRDGNKWEPCLNNSLTLRGSSLFEPVFDIYYHQREGGMPTKDAEKIPYALIISVKAVKVPDLYARVFRQYAAILQPLVPVVALPLPAGPVPRSA